MNPVTSMWINWALTAVLGGVSAYTAAGGHPDAMTITTAVGAAVAALNGAMHATASSQPGPMGK